MPRSTTKGESTLADRYFDKALVGQTPRLHWKRATATWSAIGTHLEPYRHHQDFGPEKAAGSN